MPLGNLLRNSAVVLESPQGGSVHTEMGLREVTVKPTVPDFRNENQVCGRKVFGAVESTRLKGGARRHYLRRGSP